MFSHFALQCNFSLEALPAINNPASEQTIVREKYDSQPFVSLGVPLKV